MFLYPMFFSLNRTVTKKLPNVSRSCYCSDSFLDKEKLVCLFKGRIAPLPQESNLYLQSSPG